MADEHNEAQAQEQAPSEAKTSFTQEEMDAYAEEKAAALKAKLDEVLGEKKSAKAKADELARKQEEDERARLTEKEEFKTLWEKEQEEKRSYQEQLTSLQQRIKDAEVGKASAGIAGQLSTDTKRAALLAEKAAKYVTYNEDGSIGYEMGGVSVDQAKVIEHLRTEYDFLADGKQSTGGGAAGSRGVRDAEAKNHAADQAKKSGDVGAFLKASLHKR